MANDMQSRRAACDGIISTAINQRTADAVSPKVWLHEQTIQLGLAIRSWKNRREANNLVVHLRDEDLRCGNLLRWQYDGIGIREQGLLITRVALS
jgi:hypothetical protein